MSPAALLGALAHRQGRFAEAEGYYREAQAVAETAGDTHRLAAILVNLGLLQAVQGRPAAAEDTYGRALALARAYYKEGYQLAQQMGDPELLIIQGRNAS